jgi:hypothetical protein
MTEFFHIFYQQIGGTNMSIFIKFKDISMILSNYNAGKYR